jgi:hypothetical protein
MERHEATFPFVPNGEAYAEWLGALLVLTYMLRLIAPHCRLHGAVTALRTLRTIAATILP